MMAPTRKAYRDPKVAQNMALIRARGTWAPGNRRRALDKHMKTKWSPHEKTRIIKDEMDGVKL